MKIEIRRAGFVNKGAELMLLAALEQLKARYPQATFVMAPSYNSNTQPFAKFTRLGMLPKASLWRYRVQWGDLASLIPAKIRRMFGLVLDREIDVVIDAAGFAYSDQWGPRCCTELARSARRWKKQGTKLILMPQALGPFTSDTIKADMRSVVAHADLVFAREPASYDYLTAVTGEQPKLQLRPDFTNLLAGQCPESFQPELHQICIVPNYRMIDKTDAAQAKAYLPFLIKCCQYLLSKGEKPFILVHEGAADLKLAEQISEAVGGLPILIEDDALKIKGILGACKATIGSRFHGLVSALCQGTPALATGWSHKYQMLFNDYDFKDGLVDVTADDASLFAKIDMLIDPQQATELKQRLLQNSARLKQQTAEMWSEVFRVIEQQ